MFLQFKSEQETKKENSPNRIIKQNSVLRNDSEKSSQIFQTNCPNVFPINQNLSVDRIEETEN